MSAHNVVVLRGTLVAELRWRELPSGQLLGQFDITTRPGAQAGVTGLEEIFLRLTGEGLSRELVEVLDA